MQDSKEEVSIVIQKSLKRKILEEVTHLRSKTNFYQAHNGSSHKIKIKQKPPLVFSTELIGLYELYIYRPAHTTLSFTL